MNRELLQNRTSAFAEAVRSCFRDMLAVEIVSEFSDFVERSFAPRHRLVAMIHFTGPVQGDYVLTLDEDTAARLIGGWSEGMSNDELRALRPDFSGLLKELLNTAVGMSIAGLEAEFGRLTYFAPMVVFGELDCPAISSCSLELRSSAGVIDCCLVLDMTGSDAERALVKAMSDLEAARVEMVACCRVLTDLIEHTRHSPTTGELVSEAEKVLVEVRAMFAIGSV